MGNLIITNDFIPLSGSDVSVPSIASGYSASSLLAYGSLARHVRTTAASPGELLTIDFGAPTQMAAIFLNDVNFSKVLIQGADDLFFTEDDLGDGDTLGDGDGLDPAMASFSFDVSFDPVVGRYKIIAETPGFFYRYLRVSIPADAAVTESAAYWRMSSLVPLATASAFSVNMDYDYERGASAPFHETAFSHGGDERLSLGETLKFTCSCQFGARSLAAESELWTLNRMSISGRLVFYENMGDTSRAYIVLRDDAYSGTMIHRNRVTGRTIRFKEQI